MGEGNGDGPGSNAGAVVREKRPAAPGAGPALTDDEWSDQGDDFVVGQGWIDRIGEG
jgi:hypothetical protein